MPRSRALGLYAAGYDAVLAKHVADIKAAAARALETVEPLEKNAKEREKQRKEIWHKWQGKDKPGKK
jgi:hypothetical protein